MNSMSSSRSEPSMSIHQGSLNDLTSSSQSLDPKIGVRHNSRIPQPISKLHEGQRIGNSLSTGSSSQIDILPEDSDLEIKALKSKLHEMNSRLAEAFKNQAIHAIENKELQNECTSLCAKFDSALSEKAAIQSKLHSLQDNIRIKTETSESENIILKDLRDSLQVQSERTRDLKESFNEAMRKTTEVNGRVYSLTAEKERILGDKFHIEESLSALQIEYFSFREKSEENKELILRDIEEKDKEVQKMKESTLHFEASHRALEEELSKIECLTIDPKSSESMHCELKSVNEDLSQSLAEMEAKYYDKLSIIAQSDKEKKILESENEVLSAEMSALQTKICNSQVNWKEKYEDLCQRYEDSTALCHKLQGNILSISQELNAAMGVTRDNAEVKVLNQTISLLQDELSKARSELAHGANGWDGLREQYEGLKTMIAPYREQLEQYEHEKTALLSQNKEARGELQRAAQALSQKLGHQNHNQKVQIMVRLKQENMDLKLALRKTEAEGSRLKKKQDQNDSLLASNTPSKHLGYNSPLRTHNRSIRK